MEIIKIKKLVIALLLVSVTHMAMGSFTGSVEKKTRSLYTLKNFNRGFYKNASPFALKFGFEYKGVRFLSEKKDGNGDVTINSVMRFERGNTTYIYPYTHKVVVSKFQTPSAPSVR